MLSDLDKIGVSVVICVYNGASRIKTTLEHLFIQKEIDFDWEILIIDNNSTDNTIEVATAYWQTTQSGCAVRVIEEKQAGTMHARKSGILNAKYRYLLYCDDDNWLHESYVKSAFAQIISKPTIAAVGGRGILEFEKGFVKPGWIDRYASYFGSGAQGIIDGDTTENKGCLYTAGAILDRVWVDKLFTTGFESMLKGRDGTSLVAGEDTELTYALKTIGGKLFYCSQMHFKHFMPDKRMNWAYLVRLSNAIGFSNYLLRPYTNTLDRIYLRDYIITTLLILKYKTKALFSFFKEGDDNVIIYSTFSGQLKAIKSSGADYENITSIVKKLHARK